MVLAIASLPVGATHNADDHSQNMKHLANVPASSVEFQSDLAFKGRYAFAGNYNGFRIIDISDPQNPTVRADVWCPGPQNDVSVWGDVVITSTDSVMQDDRCGSPRAADPLAAGGWEGLRVFRLSEILAATPDADGFVRVQPVATVYQDCGSHTHTGIPDGNRVIVYNSSYPLRSGPTCGPENAVDPVTGETRYDPLHKKIGIVKVPLGNPENSRHLKYQPVDVPTWNIYEDVANVTTPGLNPVQGCHDVQVHLGLDRAAAACISEGQLWNISDPLNPQTLIPKWRVDKPQIQFYHSALFSEDTNTVIMGDEIVNDRSCDDGTGAGQIWFHSRASGSTLGSFQIPRPQPGQYCSAHLFNNIPGISRDVLVSSWYGGGTTVVDFTDPSNAQEIGYYDLAHEHTEAPAGGSGGITPQHVEQENHGTQTWSAYWYNNRIYANDGAARPSRGFDIFPFSGKERRGATKVSNLNPQTQY
jgi:LVIVD repeat